MKAKIIIFLFFLINFSVKAQVHCANVQIDYTDADRIDFTFDNFNKYLSGITYNAIATIKIRVDQKTPIDPDCRWLLRMQVDNNPTSGSAAQEWETRMQYSATSSTPKPTIDILNVRVDNSCHTPLNAGLYQQFLNHADQLDIIENTGILISAGSCVQNVNGPGNYLSNYDEFIFHVDLRITPGFTYRPGIYELRLTFQLEEVI